jgi:predicted membrane protein
MTAETHDQPLRLHVPTLAVALSIMLVGSLYPPLMTNAAGQVNHGLALALLCAMSAGFVRGVGFMPRHAIWRLVFSGWTCCGALAIAVCVKYFS